jgi:hypothetical protein
MTSEQTFVCLCGVIHFNFVHNISGLYELGLPYILVFYPKISVLVAFFALYKRQVFDRLLFLKDFAYCNGTENAKEYFYYLFRKYVILMLY